MAESQQKTISFGDGIPPDRRKAEFGVVTITSGTGHGSDWRLVLPRNWKRMPDDPAKTRDGLSAVASFAPSNDVSVTVFSCVVPYEVNLRDWLEYECHLRGFELIDAQSAENENGQVVHAQARTVDGDQLRMMLSGDGVHLVWFVGRSARQAAAANGETLGLIAASFQFAQHSGLKTRERLSVYEDSTKAFRLLHPASWTPKPLIALRPQKTAADFRMSVEGNEIGYMRVAADSRQPRDEAGLRKMFETAVEEVEEVGVTVRSLEPVPAGRNGGERQRWLGECMLPGGVGQVALLFRPAPRHWLAATLITPGKTQNPMAWMRGKRFYEIVSATLAPGD